MALLVAALLLLLAGAWTAPAVAGPDKQPDTTLDDHPSGKDRSEEPGASGTQGKSTSDPDGTANGGADKPGGAGGFDADKDGNNGCGNDDDFEDDNNGNCGGRVQAQGATTPSTTTQSTSGTTPVTTPTTTETAVAGVSFVQPPPVDDTKVLGVAFVRGDTAAAAPSALAATGVPAVELVAVACTLIALGVLLTTGARRREVPLA